jgi:hypothetical protein
VFECMRVTDVFMAGHFRKIGNILPLLLGVASVKLKMQKPGKGHGGVLINYFPGTIERVGIRTWNGTWYGLHARISCSKLYAEKDLYLIKYK